VACSGFDPKMRFVFPIRRSGQKCLLKYDDPTWVGEWVETSRMRKR